MLSRWFITAVVASAVPLVCSPSVWTNAAGRAFTAEICNLTDRHVFFVMPDGTTNRLALAALTPASEKAARLQQNMAEIPESMKPVFRLCAQDLQRIDNLYAEELLDADERADARQKIIKGFRMTYRKHNLPPSDYAALEKRLLSGR